MAILAEQSSVHFGGCSVPRAPVLTSHISLSHSLSLSPSHCSCAQWLLEHGRPDLAALSTKNNAFPENIDEYSLDLMCQTTPGMAAIFSAKPGLKSKMLRALRVLREKMESSGCGANASLSEEELHRMILSTVRK